MATATAPSAPSRSTRPSADETRERILAAALDLFSERSFEGATTRRIAERAGVTQPLLNYHFRTKDDLWRAAVEGVFTRLRSALDDRVDGLRGVDELTTAKLIVREFVLFSAANPQLHRIIMQECKTDGPRMDALVDTYIRPLYEETAQRLTHLADAGLIAPFPAVQLYYLLTGAGATLFVLAPECRRLTGIDPFDPAVIEQHADAVTALLFARPQE